MKRPRYADASEEVREDFKKDYLDSREIVNYTRRGYIGKIVCGLLIGAVVCFGGYLTLEIGKISGRYNSNISEQMSTGVEKVERVKVRGLEKSIMPRSNKQ